MRKAAVLVVALFGVAHGTRAADWPQYAGPNGDTTSPEMIRTNWAEEPPREVWRKAVGPGFSSMAVVGDQVFTLVRRSSGGADREFCIALDTATGNELWAADVDVADYDSLSGYDDAMDGPRSTPTVDGDRVYVFTSQLKLVCLRRDDGSRIWRRDFRSELGSSVIAWQNAASPLLEGDRIFVNANASGRRLMALNKSDGSTIWSGQNDTMTHATPILARVAGTPQVIFLTRSGLVALAPEDGVVLWRLPFSPSSTSTAASPVAAGQYVYATAAYGSGMWIAKVSEGPEGWGAVEASRQQGNAYQCHWSTPVRHEGFLYCVASPSSSLARLTCLDVEAGSNRWTQSTVGSQNIGFGSLIKCANALIVLTEAGELVLVEPNPAEYREMGRFKVLNRYCWNHVALANGRIYARNTSSNPELVALEVAAAAPPLPRLSLATERGGGGALTLSVRALDGSDLDPNQTGRVELLSSTNLLAPVAQWSVLNPMWTGTNGLWITEIPLDVEPARFVRTREKAGTN